VGEMTASGAVAFAAAATAAVAIANLVFLWLNARATREHEARMQRMALLHAQRGDAYVEFVVLMHRVRDSAETALNPPRDPP
jgi:hypothetical protein